MLCGRTDASQPDLDMAAQIANFFGVTIDYLMGNEPQERPKLKGVKIPVLWHVHTGIPIEAIENILVYEEITEELACTGEFFGFYIKGDSMEPRLQDGDVVIVRRQPDAETGDAVVVLINGQDATVKYIRKSIAGITLIPGNPAYDPMFFSNQEVEQLPVVVLGVVEELRGKKIKKRV